MSSVDFINVYFFPPHLELHTSVPLLHSTVFAQTTTDKEIILEKEVSVGKQLL